MLPLSPLQLPYMMAYQNALKGAEVNNRAAEAMAQHKALQMYREQEFQRQMEALQQQKDNETLNRQFEKAKFKALYGYDPDSGSVIPGLNGGGRGSGASTGGAPSPDSISNPPLPTSDDTGADSSSGSPDSLNAYANSTIGAPPISLDDTGAPTAASTLGDQSPMQGDQFSSDPFSPDPTSGGNSLDAAQSPPLIQAANAFGGDGAAPNEYDSGTPSVLPPTGAIQPATPAQAQPAAEKALASPFGQDGLLSQAGARMGVAQQQAKAVLDAAGPGLLDQARAKKEAQQIIRTAEDREQEASIKLNQQIAEDDAREKRTAARIRMQSGMKTMYGEDGRTYRLGENGMEDTQTGAPKPDDVHVSSRAPDFNKLAPADKAAESERDYEIKRLQSAHDKAEEMISGAGLDPESVLSAKDIWPVHVGTPGDKKDNNIGGSVPNASMASGVGMHDPDGKLSITAIDAPEKVIPAINQYRQLHQKLESMKTQSAPLPSAPKDAIPTISSPNEARKLPRGTRFRSPDGQIRVVP